MINGRVSPTREALIRIVVSGAEGRSLEFEAVVDTGFTDYLTAPKALIDELALRYRESIVYELANGELDTFDLHEARVFWDSEWRDVIISVAEGGPLVGMAMLEGCHLGIDVREGGAVTIHTLRE